jgi:hypothetical protein
MLWFVDPKQPKRAVNLQRCSGVFLDGTAIYFIVSGDDIIWRYTYGADAEKVYEAIIKLVQQTRYRLKSYEGI